MSYTEPRTVSLSSETWQAIDMLHKLHISDEAINELLLYLTTQVATDNQFRQGHILIDCVVIDTNRGAKNG